MRSRGRDTDRSIHRRIELLIEDAYGMRAERVERIHSGTASDNFVVTTPEATRWFVKCYRTAAEIPQAEAAIGLADFAGRGGTPVPQIRLTTQHEVIAQRHGVAASLWEHVDRAETAEGGLRGRRWSSVGTTLGLLHRHLATHPAGPPRHRAPVELFDLDTTVHRYDCLIDDYRSRTAADDFTVWAVEALVERRSRLPQVARMLARLPALTVQILHGDLASPNVLLRGDDVAAIVDFQPPSQAFLSWEIARIACDPRTLATNPHWREELPRLVEAYRQANPGAPEADLASTIAMGCAYTIASTYPLAALVRRLDGTGDPLRTYARQRHQAAVDMLEDVS